MKGLPAVGMEREGYRARVGDVFYFYFFLFAVRAAFRKADIYYNLADAPGRLRTHYFLHFAFCPINIKLMYPARNRQRGKQATGKRRSYKIGGRKPLPFSMVIHGRICFYQASGMKMCGGSAQVTGIDYFRGHVLIFDKISEYYPFFQKQPLIKFTY
jgi:hypothetical protein